MKRARLLTFALLIAGLIPSGMAMATALDTKAVGAKTFYVDQRAGANQVVIISQSTIEDFTSVINSGGGPVPTRSQEPGKT